MQFEFASVAEAQLLELKVMDCIVINVILVLLLEVLKNEYTCSKIQQL